MNFREVELFRLQKNELVDDLLLKKLRAAFTLCWELPQVVNDRFFSSSIGTIAEKDRARLESVLFSLVGGLCEAEMECMKFNVMPKFHTNVSLKVITGYYEPAKIMFASFATECRAVEISNENDKILPTIDIPLFVAIRFIPRDQSISVSVADEISPSSEDELVSHAFGLTTGWLQYGLAKKMLSWTCNPDFHFDDNQSTSTQIRSMRLVDPEIYLPLYLTMKENIGQYWIKNWPERTDPQKFVFEELAIATYLLTIMRQEGITATKFADLGCGNGFLTYALNNVSKYVPEIGIDITGVGLDVRKRNIWDLYPNVEGKLIEEAVTVDSIDTFSDVEWFIGNHSDELTPWIPYIASKCGPNSKVFLLPCCPYDFRAKFNHRVAGKSLYQGYLDYVERVCVLCGFEVRKDRMRIPSTKRVCFVCTKRADLSPETRLKYEKELQGLVGSASHVTEPLLPPPIEIRNCTGLAIDVKHSILSELFAMLLDQKEDLAVINLRNGMEWRAGGRLLLSDAIQKMSEQSVKMMRDQDGGLKTFAKNYSRIFTVISGSVLFKMHPIAVEHAASRKPRVKKYSSRSLKKSIFTSECWFETFHPDGCPYFANGDECAAKHEKHYPGLVSSSDNAND